VNSNIVLGVNPDEKDKLDSVDTTFLQFKKYFQRVFYLTDEGYLQKISRLNINNKYDTGVHLIVFGHSLNVTDEDILKQVFQVAKTITIYYHSSTSKKERIENLIEIFGKEGFDLLRSQQCLKFSSQEAMVWEES
jgi:hypothetical protein